MNKKIILLLSIFTFALNSCGTILYPDRRNQHVGENSRIDAGVAVLDGIGLLFFLIPGVVAFGVDFATGAIYLPKGKSNRTIEFGSNTDNSYGNIYLPNNYLLNQKYS